MIPKEKALELCNKFMIHNSYQAIVWHNARICAIIAVDEIIQLRKGYFDCTNKIQDESFWQEVKQEIEKL